MALECLCPRIHRYSTRPQRSSPIGHGTLLQLTLVRLHAEQSAVLGEHGAAGGAETASSDDLKLTPREIASQARSAVLAIGRYILARRVTISDDLERLVAGAPPEADAPAHSSEAEAHACEARAPTAPVPGFAGERPIAPVRAPAGTPAVAPAEPLTWRTADFAAYCDID